MGQKQSQPQLNITKANFNPDTEIVGKTYDPHYGDIKIVRDFKTKETMILKEVVLNTKESFDQEVAYFNARVAVRHPNVISVIGFNSQDKHNFCSTYYKLSLYIEHVEENLQTLLENRRASKTPFTEGELLLIADDLITGLSYFQTQGFSHGDIRPFNIFYKDQVYKLSDPSLNAQRNSNALTFAIVQGIKTNLSPELIQQVPQQKFEITANKYKSDVYALGITLLSLATLTGSEDLYNFERGVINEDLIRERLNNVKQNYSEFTHDLIEDMLLPQEEQRPDSITIANKVSPHREYMRREYRGKPNVDSRTNLDQREERVKRANLPTNDDDEVTSYKVGSLEELEARIRAAILRTEETFRLVKATPGLSGVYRVIEAKYPDINTTSITRPERLARSQVGQDTTAHPTNAYDYNTSAVAERNVRAAAPGHYESASANVNTRSSGTHTHANVTPGGYTSNYTTDNVRRSGVEYSTPGAYGTTNYGAGISGSQYGTGQVEASRTYEYTTSQQVAI